MAIDSRDKRSSAISPTMPWRGLFPVPDGAINSAGDRQHVDLMYRGIAANVYVPPAAGVGGYVIWRQRRRIAEEW